jgi:hypothetical protein
VPALPQGTENTSNELDFYRDPAAFRETHEIHTSEMRSFQGCKRRWNWAYREGYVVESSPKPLEFGIAFHVAQEAGYNPETWKKTTPEQKLQAAIDAFTAECERQRIEYLRVTHQTKLMEAEGDDYADRIELGIGMLTYYWLQVHPEQDKWFKPVMTEVPFSVPIRNEFNGTLRCMGGDGSCGQFHPQGAVVTFNGRIDLIIWDKVNGGYYIWDHKSAVQLAKDDRILLLDPQMGGYDWAASLELNLDVRGSMYVEYRKAYPMPPAVLKRAYRGRIFSTDKNQATNLELFTKTVAEHDPIAFKEGRYDEYLEFLKSKDAPEFHRRFTLVKTRKHLRNIGKVIYDIASEMVSPTTPITPHVGRFSCSGCAYYQPCLAMFMGEDHTHSLSTAFKKVK